MQRLIRRLRDRRRRERDEGGAVAVLVVILAFVLVGMASFAVDAGLMVSTKAQLQNGADASSLALAQYCAKNAPSTCSSAYDTTLAPRYTKDSSLDGSAQVQGITWPTAGQVAVTTTTPAAGLKLILGGIFGTPSVQVTASATASWGAPGYGKSFPLALSANCWDLTPATTVGIVQTFEYKPGQTCTNPAGTSGPGGWGWLVPDSGTCQTTTTAGTVVTGASDPGNNLPNATYCSAVLQSWVDTITAGNEQDVTFPVFTSTTGSGNNMTYAISGYATLKIYGWKLAQGNNSAPGAFRNMASDLAAQGLSTSLACSGGVDRCVIGQFIRFDITDPNIGGSGGTDYGSNSVKLIK